MKQSARSWILVPILAVALLPSLARAEHAGGIPNYGRAVVDPVAANNLMNNLVNACLQARLNGQNFNVFGGANVASQGILPDSQGGVLQIGPGTGGPAVGSAPASVQPGAGPNPSSANGALFTQKCTRCHAPKPAGASITAINNGSMPPPPGSPRNLNNANVTLSADEKARVLTFLQTGT